MSAPSLPLFLGTLPKISSTSSSHLDYTHTHTHTHTQTNTQTHTKNDSDSADNKHTAKHTDKHTVQESCALQQSTVDVQEKPSFAFFSCIDASSCAFFSFIDAFSFACFSCTLECSTFCLDVFIFFKICLAIVSQ